MPTSPLTSDTDLISIDILIDGKEIKSEFSVLSIEVDRIANRIANAEFVLYLMPEESTGKTFELSESKLFAPGNKVEIKAGYDLKNDTIFKGILTGHGLEIKKDGQILLKVTCHDEAIKMTAGQQGKYFNDKKDSDILSSIIGGYGLEKKIEATTLTDTLVVQYQSTDWDFLVNRAEANGLLVNTQDGKVIIEKPLSSGSAELVLTYGVDVYGFNANFDARYQIPSIKSHAWDDAEQKMSESISTEPVMTKFGNFSGKDIGKDIGIKETALHTDASLSKEHLKTWANAHLVKSRLAMFQGEISFIGNHTPKINTLIKLKGFGKRFSGMALITGVHHEIQEGKWVTTTSFGLSNEWFHDRVNSGSATQQGLFPNIQGLHLGVVSKIHEDPNGASRVLVKIPSLNENEQKVWARLSSDYATNGKGLFFYPEVNDEVIISFIDNNPQFAVILGKLYSKKNKPPFVPDEKNQFKGIVSRSDLRLVFDDEDKIVSISTPEKQEITLSDKDKNMVVKDANGNTITLSSSGIELESNKDVTISAKGNIVLDAKQNITLKSSGGDVDLQGLNVKAKANMAFEASGMQSAKVSSTGQLVIQGTMVMIN